MNIELKLASKQKSGESYNVRYRTNGGEPMDLNLVSIYTIVVRTTDDISDHDATSKPESYQYFIHLPTRTMDGEPNIRYDDPLAVNLPFFFNREKSEIHPGVEQCMLKGLRKWSQ